MTKIVKKSLADSRLTEEYETPPGKTRTAVRCGGRYFRHSGIGREVLAKRGAQSILSPRETTTDASP